MIPHLSNLVTQPTQEDPALAFPKLVSECEILLPNGNVAEFVTDCGLGTWSMSLQNGERREGRLSESIELSGVSIRTWPTESPALLSQVLGTDNPRHLLDYCGLDPKQVRAHLAYLDRVRSALSGNGPFPIDFYRVPQNGFGPSDIAEEADIVRGHEVSAADTVLAHIRFYGAHPAEVLIRENGSALARGAQTMVELEWPTLKFPGLQQPAAIEKQRREAA